MSKAQSRADLLVEVGTEVNKRCYRKRIDFDDSDFSKPLKTKKAVGFIGR